MLVFLTVVLNKQKTRLQQVALVTLVSIFLSYDSCEWGNDSWEICKSTESSTAYVHIIFILKHVSEP